MCVFVCVCVYWERERHREREREIDDKELAHATTEADKSQGLQDDSANWDPEEPIV